MQRDVVVYRMRWPEEGEVGGVAVELAVGVAQSCLLLMIFSLSQGSCDFPRFRLAIISDDQAPK